MPWALLAKMIIGAVTQAAGAAVTGQMKENSYNTAIQQTQNARNAYTGKQGLENQVNEGQSTAMAEQAANNAMQNATMGSGSKMANAQFNKDASANAAVSGFGSGMSNAASKNATRYNAATTQADQMMKQKERETNAVNQGMSSASNGAGSVMDLIGQMSDERMKEALPRASIQDSLRNIESILYQYKDPTYPGCDDEEHVGTTAQSLEKQPLFEDTVAEDSNGFKKVDKWRLLESITAAESELQREIDELKGEKENEQKNPDFD